MKIEEMSRDEKSLLLYMESRAVDNGGTVDTRHMNSDDIKIAKRWNQSGFVKFGRLCFEDVEKRKVTHWCRLSHEAWEIVATLRKARARRVWKKREFKTTEELRRGDNEDHRGSIL